MTSTAPSSSGETCGRLTGGLDAQRRVRWRRAGDALFVIISIPLVMAIGLGWRWSTAINGYVSADLQAVWTDFRQQHCEQVGHVAESAVDRRLLMKCGGYEDLITDTGEAPEAFLQRQGHHVTYARCMARAEVLPWRTACTGLAQPL